MTANLENSAVATGLEKVTFISIPKKGNAKECSIYFKMTLISHASKVMLKTLQARLQQYMNRELPDIQGGFRKRLRLWDHKRVIQESGSKEQQLKGNMASCSNQREFLT